MMSRASSLWWLAGASPVPGGAHGTWVVVFPCLVERPGVKRNGLRLVGLQHEVNLAASSFSAPAIGGGQWGCRARA